VCHAYAMKLSQYTEQQGIRYRTALRKFYARTIKGYQTPMGTISVTATQSVSSFLEQVGASARISSAEFTDELEWQATYLFDSVLYCARLPGDSGDERDRVRRA